MKIGTWYINPKLNSHEVEVRKSAAQEWITGVQDVVNYTKDTEAQDLIKSILSNIAIGVPDRKKHLIVTQGPEHPTIILAPLTSTDSDASDTAQDMMHPQSSQAARYTENTPGRIYFNSEVALSARLKGLVMLHEAKHADFFESNQFREGSELDHWYEEAATFEFEFRLLKKLCGTGYEKIMSQLVSRFIEEYNDKDGRGGTIPSPGSINISFIDQAFGPCLSKRESITRKSIIWMDTVFRMFERIYPETAATDKARFLQQIYKN